MFESHDEAISELLKNQGLVRLSELEEIRQRARTIGVSLARALVDEGALAPATLVAALAGHLGLAWIEPAPDALSDELVTSVPSDLARQQRIVPLRRTGAGLEVLAMDPFSRERASDLGFMLGCEVTLVVADPRSIERLLRRYYGDGEGVGELVREPTGSPSASDLTTLAGQAPVIRFVNQVLAQAIRERASDVHLEPSEHEYKVRARIDGVLRDLALPPKALALPVASRVKLLADLDIAERRRPQDGRIRTVLAGRSVDLRVSTLPTQFGESVVIRLLDQSAVPLELGQLGLPDDVRAGLREAIRRPNGIVLVTGPTSSGKSTTLYSALREINAVGAKLLTAEDPVEYEVDGIIQVSVNPGIGLTFATAMRAFLRQDPDVIMVGEIRDEETARIATQAALTGHLVLSTLHTNDAPSTVARLLDLGVEPFLLASTVEGVLAQRLVRRICPHCRSVVPGTPDGAPPGLIFYQGTGCQQCGQTGYRGRIGIYEWLQISEPLRELIGRNAPGHDLLAQARAEGMRTLREDGLRAASAGDTTWDEIIKYT